MDTKNRFGYFLEYVAVLVLFGLLNALPDRTGAALGRALGRLLGAVVRSRTRIARSNMRAAFPGTSEETIASWLREMWSNLGQSTWEFTRAAGLSSEDFLKLVQLDGREHLAAARAQGRGVILVSAHFTNWEVNSQAMAIAVGEGLAAIARRLKNPYVNDFVTRRRSSLNTRIFMHKNAVRESIKWLKAGNVVGILVDQRITAGGVQIPFFGRPAHTTILPALLALRLGAPVLPVHTERRDGRLRAVIGPALDFSRYQSNPADVVKATADINRVVESWVRETPPHWLWIHDRWK